MKIVDKKQPTNTSLLPTVWIGSPDSPVGANVSASASASRIGPRKTTDGPSGETPIRKSA